MPASGDAGCRHNAADHPPTGVRALTYVMCRWENDR